MQLAIDAGWSVQISLSVNCYLDTMLFHQGLGLLFDRGGAYWLVTLNPHRGLDSLDNFFIQVGADVHHFPPKETRLVRPMRGVAGVVAYYIVGSAKDSGAKAITHISPE